ncbi:histone-fold-containing protein [Cladochytrium replicatum]|nr:histone-fold-containing protein [Cladochytrium replicatum]
MSPSLGPTSSQSQPSHHQQQQPQSRPVHAGKGLPGGGVGRGLGKGKGKGIGAGLSRRRKQMTFQDNLLGITKPAIRRLARRGGVRRISNGIYHETRIVLKEFLHGVLRDACLYVEHRGGQTMTAVDIVYALKRRGTTFYGIGEAFDPKKKSP